MVFRFIRLWIDGINEPIIELYDGFEPIKCARWSPTNSTLLACTTSTKLKLWDLKTNCLQPAAIHNFNECTFNKGFNNFTNAELTMCCFTSCGQSLVVGSEDGVSFIFALEDMPFLSHFQQDVLEDAVMRNSTSNPRLKKIIIESGFFNKIR